MSFLKTYGPKLGLRDDRNVLVQNMVCWAWGSFAQTHTCSHRFFLLNYCIYDLLDQCLLYL